METLMLIGFLLLGLLTSLSLIFFSKQFNVFDVTEKKVDLEEKQRTAFFRRIQQNTVRIKHIHA
jgi:CBS domain containing-hemolysin-like protein